MKFENFLDIFFRKALTYHISWKSIQCGPGFCMRTSDGQKKLMVVFRNFAKAPEKKKAMWNFNRIWAHGADPHIKCLWWMLFFMMESWAFQGVQYSSSSRRWTSFSGGKFWPSQRHLSISPYIAQRSLHGVNATGAWSSSILSARDNIKNSRSYNSTPYYALKVFFLIKHWRNLTLL